MLEEFLLLCDRLKQPVAIKEETLQPIHSFHLTPFHLGSMIILSNYANARCTS